MSIKEKIFKYIEIKEITNDEDIAKLFTTILLMFPCLHYLGIIVETDYKGMIKCDNLVNDDTTIKFSIPESYSEPMNLYVCLLDNDNKEDYDFYVGPTDITISTKEEAIDLVKFIIKTQIQIIISKIFMEHESYKYKLDKIEEFADSYFPIKFLCRTRKDEEFNKELMEEYEEKYKDIFNNSVKDLSDYLKEVKEAKNNPYVEV